MFDCLTEADFFFDDLWKTAIEAWEEYDEDQLREHNEKKEKYKREARKSYILQEYLLPIVDTVLKNASKERILFRYIAEYADRNVDILSSPYFTKNMLFTQKDEEIVFTIFGIDKRKIAEKIKEMPKPPTNTGSVNVTPFRVLMIFIIGHYARTKEYKKMEYIYRYYAYSQFSTLFHSVGFRQGVLKPEAMEYAIDNMEKKFHMKKYGSLDLTITEAMKMAVFNFLKADKEDKPDFRDLSDFAVLQLAMALKSRQAAWMKKVYAAYKAALDSGEYITSRGEDYDEDSGDIVERETVTGNVKQLADKYTLAFFTSPIAKNLVTMSAKRCDVSESELRGVLEMLWDQNRRGEVNNFLSALFQLFFNENSKYTEKDIHSAVFGATADAIFRRSNSNDPLVAVVKDTTNAWLMKGSKIYRGTNRTATKSNYKRAIYLYFVFMIMWRN